MRSVHASMRRVTTLSTLACGALLAGGCGDHAGVVAGTHTMTSNGGTFELQCIDRSEAKVVSWDPKPGYTVRVIVAGPSPQVSFVFESATANDYRVFAHCLRLEPKMVELEYEDTTID
jgi:hypothetical protein